jgi:cytoskeletal protein CcmA (bactofilin family)
MFGTTEKTSAKIETFVGAGTEIEGNIHTPEVVRVDGKIKGEVNAESVVIGPNGIILGDITANKVTVAGKIKGNISAATTLELLPTGQILGDIRTNKLLISDGAKFEGNCQMVKADGQDIEMNSTTDMTLEPDLPNSKKHLKVLSDNSRH